MTASRISCNELRNAGAEAIAVEDVRIVPGAVVAGAGGSLTLGERPLGNPVHIRAIGTPSILTGSLTRVGGPIAQLGARFPEVLVEVEALDSIDLPATDRDLVPTNGLTAPRPGAASPQTWGRRAR